MCVIDKNFILAGHAIFTCHNAKGEHHTFCVNKVPHTSDPTKFNYFVKVLAGPDNTRDYVYMGMLIPDSGKFILTKASKVGEDSQLVKIIRWIFRNVWSQDQLFKQSFPAGYGLHHEGRCGRCGRLLTTPESVATGYGPECSKVLGIPHELAPMDESDHDDPVLTLNEPH